MQIGSRLYRRRSGKQDAGGRMKGLGKPERDSSILIGRSDDRLGSMWSGAPSGAGEASCMPHVGQYGAHVGAQRPGGLGRHVGGGVEAVVEGVAPGLQVGFQEADVGLSACVAVGVRQVAVGGSRQEVVYAGLSGQQAVRDALSQSSRWCRSAGGCRRRVRWPC